MNKPVTLIIVQSFSFQGEALAVTTDSVLRPTLERVRDRLNRRLRTVHKPGKLANIARTTIDIAWWPEGEPIVSQPR